MPQAAERLSIPEAFALMLEAACEDFTICCGLLSGELKITRVTGSHASNTAADYRAGPRAAMAMAKSFVFHAVRARRICEHSKGALNVDRTERLSFVRQTAQLLAIRDVNEHGFDVKGSRSHPRMHDHGDVFCDETGMVYAGPGKLIMGRVNLCEIYPIVNRMRERAGFLALAQTQRSQAPLG
jgi:hypothetical protein